MRMNDENANFECSDVVLIILIWPEKQFSTLKAEMLFGDFFYESAQGEYYHFTVKVYIIPCTVIVVFVMETSHRAICRCQSNA